MEITHVEVQEATTATSITATRDKEEATTSLPRTRHGEGSNKDKATPPPGVKDRASGNSRKEAQLDGATGTRGETTWEVETWEAEEACRAWVDPAETWEEATWAAAEAAIRLLGATGIWVRE